MTKRNTRTRSRQDLQNLKDKLSMINPNAAFVDVGSGEHWVCVPEGRCEDNVRQCGAFTCDLYAIRDWLLEHNITSVAMESTGVYWINLYQVLEDAGMEVCLVNARDLKMVKGRPKTDKLDCQWGQRLHSYGLLRSSFRPDREICAIRSIWRMREKAVKDAGRCIQRMSKALYEMNVLLPKVVSDITGQTGMRIIRSILDGQRDPKVLASFRDHRCKKSEEEIAKSLKGDYRSEQIFLLQAALDQYEFITGQIAGYDREIERRTGQLPVKRALTADERKVNETTMARDRRKSNNAVSFDARSAAHELTGVDLAAIPGLGSSLCLCILFETGTDMSKWPTEKHFASWLGLSPNPKVSAGRDLGTRTKKCASNASGYFRAAATSLARSHCHFGEFFRRMRARHGGAHAVTATAHKLAVLFYNLVRRGEQYKQIDQSAYRQMIHEQRINNLKKRAEKLGFALVPDKGGTKAA